MQKRLIPAILAVLLFVGAHIASAQTYRLRYEAEHYATAFSVVQHHVVHQRASAESLNVAIYEYRLDQKDGGSSQPDSTSLGRGEFDLRQFSRDSLQSYRTMLVNSPTAVVLKDHEIEYLGHVDTIAGLPSYMFAITVESVRQYLVWLAPAPPGLENLVLWQTLEYPKRKISFLVEEELCNMIRLVLLRGCPFPPGNTGNSTPFIITRFDTAVNIDLLTVRNNTYLYELKSVTSEAPRGK